MVTCGENALSNSPDVDLDAVAPCYQEEADTRMFLHLKAVVMAGHTHVVMKTVDSDEVHLAPRAMITLAPLGLQELWIAYGCGQNFRYK